MRHGQGELTVERCWEKITDGVPKNVLGYPTVALGVSGGSLVPEIEGPVLRLSRELVSPSTLDFQQESVVNGL